MCLTAAEPWPENATLYQPLKGKSHYRRIDRRKNTGCFYDIIITAFLLCCCLTEDQILLSDCASSLAVQVMFLFFLNHFSANMSHSNLCANQEMILTFVKEVKYTFIFALM